MAIQLTSSGHYDMTSVITTGTPRFQSVTPVEQLKKSSAESEDWDFGVYQDRMLSPRTKKPTGPWGVFREDNDDYLGDYQTKCLITNREVHEAVAQTIERAGMDFEMNAKVFDHGSRAILNYDILSDLKSDKEDFNPVFSVKNSYDGTWSVEGAFSIKRLACLNGMEVSVAQAKSKRKHSRSLLGEDGKINLSFLADTFQKGLVEAQNDLRNFDKMKEIQISNEDAFNILGNVIRCSKNVVSTTTAARIAVNWVSPSEDEQGLGDTLYRLFNAGTRLFRDWEKIKADASLKARRKFCDILNLAANPSDSNPFSRGALAELKVKPSAEFALVM